MNLETVKPGAIVVNTPGIDSSSTRRNWIGVFEGFDQCRQVVIRWMYNMNNNQKIAQREYNGKLAYESDFNEDGTRTYTRQWAKRGLTEMSSEDSMILIKSFLAPAKVQNVIAHCEKIKRIEKESVYMIIPDLPSQKDFDQIMETNSVIEGTVYYAKDAKERDEIIKHVSYALFNQRIKHKVTVGIFKRTRSNRPFKFVEEQTLSY